MRHSAPELRELEWSGYWTNDRGHSIKTSAGVSISLPFMPPFVGLEMLIIKQ